MLRILRDNVRLETYKAFLCLLCRTHVTYEKTGASLTYTLFCHNSEIIFCKKKRQKGNFMWDWDKDDLFSYCERFLFKIR
ncbi:hypothetical protein Lgra_1406 [Legionella gratiana]|uniref:Uncharacterized protein n=1 Tax=Legionella gratiana TaxID=45066 RepID=A0A378JHP9_9GAMM|nr:hypothetical protein Lgra_1406 [Legionella gratiana]STX46448.1 Uncharacterised protein [Legionella gratiana]